MAINNEKHPGDAANTADIGARVVELRRQGVRYSDIGAQLGFSKQRAHQLYWDTVRSIPVQAVEAHRAEQVDEITEVIRTAAAVQARDHIAHSNGRMVLDSDGSPVLDDGPKLDAGRTIIAAHARLAKLLGLDAAVKSEVDLSGGLRYEVVGVDPDGVV